MSESSEGSDVSRDTEHAVKLAVTSGKPKPDPGPLTAMIDWDERAVTLLEQAIADIRDGGDALITVSAAEAALRIACGELPEDELSGWFDERECICPPELVARGGFKGSCPAFHEWRALASVGETG